MAMSSNKAGLLRAACDVVGGSRALAERLHISEPILRRYISGTFVPPDSLMLAALDVIESERDAAAAPPSAIVAPPDSRKEA